MRFLPQSGAVGAALNDLSSRIDGLSARASQINASINSCYEAGGIGGLAGNAAANMKYHAASMKRLANAAIAAEEIYSTAERELTEEASMLVAKYRRIDKWTINGSSDVPWGIKPNIDAAIGNGTDVPWKDKPDIDGEIAKISFLGAAASATLISTTSAIASTQNNASKAVPEKKPKSIWWKLYHTGKAVVSSAASVAGNFALWGAAVASGGVGAPIAALGTVYTANTVSNSLVDIYNCWWGDTEEVGGVNCLKDVLIENGGDLGAAFGNREIGETIGEVVYTSGGVVSTLSKVESLVGKTIQAGDLWENAKGAVTEASTGLKGLWDIATHSDIRAVSYDLKLLSYQVNNITEVHNAYKLLSSVASTTEKIEYAA